MTDAPKDEKKQDADAKESAAAVAFVSGLFKSRLGGLLLAALLPSLAVVEGNASVKQEIREGRAEVRALGEKVAGMQVTLNGVVKASEDTTVWRRDVERDLAELKAFVKALEGKVK